VTDPPDLNSESSLRQEGIVELSHDREVAWGVSAQAKPGEHVSGDLHVIEAFDNGILIGAIDGLGHGPEAARCAALARAELAVNPGRPLDVLVKACHQALVGSRGVVLTLARLLLSPMELTWLSVGNVDGMLLRAKGQRLFPVQRAVLRGGVVGYQLPLLRPEVVRLQPNDLLVLATDGVRIESSAEHSRPQSPRALADVLLADGSTRTDDSLVVVAKYLDEFQS